MEKVTAKLKASESAVKQFQKDKLGLAVQFGLYSILAKTEWVMFNEKIAKEEYKKLMLKFNPAQFDSHAWVQLIKEAGMHSLLIVPKHHDGFCLFDSSLTDYKVTNTPFGRDLIAELSEACHTYGIKLHFFYSLLDWYHPDYLANWPEYVKYYQGQVKELCTNYGKIGGILFDGWWPAEKLTPEQEYFQPKGDWDLTGTYDLVHSLQPDAMVTTNHHILPLPGEDYQVFELVLPGDTASIPTLGEFNAPVGEKPLATWTQLSKNWCYSIYDTDKDFKSPRQLYDLLQKCIEKKCYLHLNVGPMPNGRFRSEEIESLKGLGKLLNNHH